MPSATRATAPAGADRNAQEFLCGCRGALAMYSCFPVVSYSCTAAAIFSSKPCRIDGPAFHSASAASTHSLRESRDPWFSAPGRPMASAAIPLYSWCGILLGEHPSIVVLRGVRGRFFVGPQRGVKERLSVELEFSPIIVY